MDTSIHIEMIVTFLPAKEKLYSYIHYTMLMTDLLSWLEEIMYSLMSEWVLSSHVLYQCLSSHTASVGEQLLFCHPSLRPE